MSNPYKTREGGATVTVFVPYDCNNHCPFCINKKEYADCTGFSLDAILESIRTMDAITPRCDFVFTGGEPLANLESLQKMLDVIPTTHKVYINTTFPVQTGFYTAEEASKRTAITSVRVVNDLPTNEQPRFEYLSTESATFAAYAEAIANRRDPFFITPAGGADICNIRVPVRRAAE